jgi:hypothetical protein
MQNHANARRMELGNASVARQWHRKIAPMRTLEYVRGGHQADAIAVTHQSRSGQRLKPALIHSRQRHCALQ